MNGHETGSGNLRMVLNVAPILAMLVACIWWGLKLDAELLAARNDLAVAKERIARIEAQVGVGVLNVAKARLDSHDVRIQRLEDKVIEK